MPVRRYLSVKTRAVWKPVHRLALRCGGHGAVFNAVGYFGTDRHPLVCGSFSVLIILNAKFNLTLGMLRICRGMGIMGCLYFQLEYICE